MGQSNSENNSSNTNQVSDWTEEFDADTKSYITNKGFKDPKAVLESYRNLEKLMGVPQDRIIKLPQSMDAPEMMPIWERLGRPKEAKEYTFELPKEIGDEKITQWTKDTFHKLGMPRSMAESYIKALSDKTQSEMTTLRENIEHQIKQDQEALQREWGKNYDANKNIVDQAAIKLGLSQDDIQRLGQTFGAKRSMELLHKLGSSYGESQFVAGQPPRVEHKNPDQASIEIQTLMKDTDFRRRLMSGDSEAKTKWNRLNEIAAPGQMTI